MINVIARVVAREYWENVADNLSEAGWSWGCVSAINFNGWTIWIAAAHQGDGKRCLKKERERLLPPAPCFVKTGLSFSHRIALESPMIGG